MLESAAWRNPKAMDDLRQSRLAETVRHARQNSPYYAALLGGLPEDPLAAFYAVPVTTKMDIIASGLSRAVPAALGEVRLVGKTSGSSGQPFRFEIDDLLPSRHAAQRAYVYLRAGIPRSSSILEILPGNRIDLVPDITYPTYKRRIVGYGCGSLIEHVKAVEPQLLYGNRSHLLQVAEESQARRISLSVPFVCSSSETILEEDKNILSETFGCKFFEVYGSAEASNVAFYTPEHPQWMILEPRVWVEVLDENRKPVEPGEVGELVVTTLSETISPLLRYATGDLARVGTGDGRGRSGTTLVSLEGRASDSVVDASGNKVAFWAIATPKFWGRADVAGSVSRWQVHQKADGSVTVTLEMLESARLESIRSTILQFVNSVVGDLPTTIKKVDSVHDLARGKFRAVTSEAS